MSSTAIQKTEEAIRTGNFLPQPMRYRVYKLTLSPAHLIAGCDFMLYMSFGTKELADKEAKELNDGGLYLALVIDGEYGE